MKQHVQIPETYNANDYYKQATDVAKSATATALTMAGAVVAANPVFAKVPPILHAAVLFVSIAQALTTAGFAAGLMQVAGQSMSTGVNNMMKVRWHEKWMLRFFIVNLVLLGLLVDIAVCWR